MELHIILFTAIKGIRASRAADQLSVDTLSTHRPSPLSAQGVALKAHFTQFRIKTEVFLSVLVFFVQIWIFPLSRNAVSLNNPHEKPVTASYSKLSFP